MSQLDLPLIRKISFEEAYLDMSVKKNFFLYEKVLYMVEDSLLYSREIPSTQDAWQLVSMACLYGTLGWQPIDINMLNIY
jgi:hypothetical protein